ncbi:MAG: YfiT family bacillithiol transferase [Bacteroidota bacterium]
MNELEQLRFPIGRFQKPERITSSNVKLWINQIETLPARFRNVAEHLSSEQLETAYRPDGWTLRQVIHHVPDSHVNSYIRFKWALTEENPTIKAYNEVAWAELSDYQTVPIETALSFLEILHARWVPVLKSLTSDDLDKTFIHPEHGKEVSLSSNIALYAWHGEHHLGHLVQTVRLNHW